MVISLNSKSTNKKQPHLQWFCQSTYTSHPLAHAQSLSDQKGCANKTTKLQKSKITKTKLKKNKQNKTQSIKSIGKLQKYFFNSLCTNLD